MNQSFLHFLSFQENMAVNATQSAAEAFGEDIADDSYSVSELSHYDEERRAKRHSKGKSKGKSEGDLFTERINVHKLGRKVNSCQ